MTTPTQVSAVDQSLLYPSPYKEFWQAFSKNKGAVACLALMLLIVFCAIFAPWVAPHNPSEQYRDFLLTPPAWLEGGQMQFLLGTDELGRDLLSRLIQGSRLSLLIGLSSVVMSLIPGILLGLFAGFFPLLLGPTIMLALPSLLLAVAIVTILGPSLIEHPGIVTAYALSFDGNDMLKLRNRQRHQIVGKDLAMVFQDPMTALNPSYTLGLQIEEVLRLHLKMSGKQARKRAIELLEKVEIPGAASPMDAYPHQLSGGMSQRVAIAMAIAGEPKLLIADEPTTALDVTIQAQIIELLLALQKEQNMGLVLITHDLAVVAETAQRACVMYAGQAVEVG